jgi:hypothetical protein
MNQETVNKIKELFKTAPNEIKEVILSDELNNAANNISENYKININLITDLKNIIILSLLGEITPENLALELKNKLFIGDEEVEQIIKYLDQSIFEKARLSIGTSQKKETVTEKKQTEIKEIKLSYDPVKEKLREQLMSHPLPKSNISKNEEIGEGSRDKLLEKLKVLEEIPNNEAVLNRLDAINKQIEEIKNKEAEEIGVEINETKAEEIKEEGETIVENKPKTAPYSKPPVSYNIDPYREAVDEI